MAAADLLGPGEVAMAVDVGGTTLRVGALDAGFRPEHPPRMERRRSRGLRGDPVGRLEAAVRAAVPQHRRLVGVVVGLPVTFDAATRIAVSSPNLPDLVGLDLGALLGERLGVPVILERDTVLLAQGERVAGAARGSRALLGAFVGTGLGGCMIFDGVPYRGASGGSVEIGHLPIRGEGAGCVCGNVDCVEAYASGHTLGAIAAEAGIDVADVLHHPACAERVAVYVRDTAYGIASAVNVLDPDTLLLGGGLFGRPHFPRARLAATVRAHLRAPAPREHVRIVEAALGSEAAFAGALHLLSLHLRQRRT